MIKLFMPKKNKNKNGIIMRRTLRNISIIFFIISITVFAQNNADFFFERGVEKIKESDYKGAIQDFTKAININPRSVSENRIENGEKK